MKKRLILGLVSAAALAATGLYAANTQRPATMLVLDASGSMWGQIDGKPKIAIAREAVGAMLDGWRGGDLGLMAYGHNRKGDCNDIELLQPVGAGTANGIRARVDALNPKGMTPITESVRRAAAQLRFTEVKATVILVSDGEETCNADPCALGKELEAAGVDFTAHVVGFDIQQGSKAHKQLQCLAANTGGRYVDASDAGELNRALQSVAKVAAPPASAKPRSCAVFTGGKPMMARTHAWPDGGLAATGKATHFEGIDMAPGQTPQQCQAMCDKEDACSVWVYEAPEANFRSHPVCWRWDRTVSLTMPEPSDNYATGIKAGARQFKQKDGEVCQAAKIPAPRAATVANLKPAKGCMLYAADDFKGESLLIGDKGYANEMPEGWDNRVRSLKCSARSGLYFYDDKSREGDYLMIEAGGERNRLGAVASSYIYFGTFAEDEDVLDAP